MYKKALVDYLVNTGTGGISGRFPSLEALCLKNLFNYSCRSEFNFLSYNKNQKIKINPEHDFIYDREV
ncbi:hypothetical protein BpHYR1_029562 [Brachionus plicatilis]|uniref:Uncharacterized protein n=1 Tax=Brachionus plicatilis TaxID=10195 RepID=A0A3M7RBX6_BRAPC|nr:hypothetical protein BpHYR1_029562 [Brachionus plicatilis]